MTYTYGSGSRGKGSPGVLSHDVGFITLGPKLDPPPILHGNLLSWIPLPKILPPPLNTSFTFQGSSRKYSLSSKTGTLLPDFPKASDLVLDDRLELDKVGASFYVFLIFHS